VLARQHTRTKIDLQVFFWVLARQLQKAPHELFQPAGDVLDVQTTVLPQDVIVDSGSAVVGCKEISVGRRCQTLSKAVGAKHAVTPKKLRLLP
jgi:hypothetical protein